MFEASFLPTRRPAPFCRTYGSGVPWSRSLMATLSPPTCVCPSWSLPCEASNSNALHLQEPQAQENAFESENNDTNSTDIDSYIMVDSVNDLSQDWVDDFTSTVSQESPAENNAITAPVTTAVTISPNIDILSACETTAVDQSASQPQPPCAPAPAPAPVPVPAAAPAPNDTPVQLMPTVSPTPAPHDLTHPAHREVWKALESSCSISKMVKEEGRRAMGSLQRCPYAGKRTSAPVPSYWNTHPAWPPHESYASRPYAPFFTSGLSKPTVCKPAVCKPEVSKSTRCPPRPSAPYEEPSTDDDERARVSVVAKKYYPPFQCHESPTWADLDASRPEAIPFHDNNGPNVGKQLQPPNEPSKPAPKTLQYRDFCSSTWDDPQDYLKHYHQHCRDVIAAQTMRLETLSDNILMFIPSSQISSEDAKHPEQRCCLDHCPTVFKSERPPSRPWRSPSSLAKARWTRSAIILGCLCSLHLDDQTLSPCREYMEEKVSGAHGRQLLKPDQLLEEAYSAIDLAYKAYGLGPGLEKFREWEKRFQGIWPRRGLPPMNEPSAKDSGSYDVRPPNDPASASGFCLWKGPRPEFTAPVNDVQESKSVDTPKSQQPGRTDDTKPRSAPAPPPPRRKPTVRLPIGPPSDLQEGRRWRY